MSRKDAHVARFKRAKVAGIESGGYDVIDGRGRFAAGGGVEVGGRRLTARSFVISTGSRSAILPLPGLDDVPMLTSDSAMRLTEQPRRLIVQGAGAIGLELGQFFARIGTEVVLVNRSALLSRFDAECGEELKRALDAEPRFDVLAPGTIERLAPAPAGLVATVRHGSETLLVEADALLMAAGRDPALDGIGLEEVGLVAELGCGGFDLGMRTSNPSIFVAGDATGACQVLHIANQEGVVAGHNAALAALGRDDAPRKRMDYRLRMSMIFTDPPYADVGETESAARHREAEVVVGRAEIPKTGRAITMEARFGLWKLVVDRSSREILGATLLGPRADDIAHELAVMMFYRARVDDIPEMPWYHPTLSEVMLDISRDALRQLD
jgi:mercuric reductase